MLRQNRKTNRRPPPAPIAKSWNLARCSVLRTAFLALPGVSVDSFISDGRYDLFEFMPGFVAILRGPEHTYEYINAAYREISGPRQFIGRRVREVFPELAGQGFFELLDQVYNTGERYAARSVPVRLDREDGDRFVDLLYNPIRDATGAVTGIFVGGYDTTYATRAREQWRILAQLSDRLRLADNFDRFAYDAAELLGTTLNVSRVGYGTIDNSTATLFVDRDWTSDGVESLAGATPLLNYGSFIESLRRGEFIAINDVRLDHRTAMASDALEGKSARSFVNVPVLEYGELVAVLFVNHGEVHHWQTDELDLIREVAQRTRSSFEKGRDEKARHQGEEIRAALYDLAERWRDSNDATEIAFAAAEVLGRTLGVSRAGYGTVDLANETITIERDWNAPGITSLAGVLRFRDYGSYIEDLKRGETVVFADAYKDERTKARADALKAISAQSVVNMPVSEHGGLVALLYLNHEVAREWSTAELDFIRDVAERTRITVERVRGVERLFESENRFRGVAEALPGFVWTAQSNGELDYTSPRWTEYSGDGQGESLGQGWATFVHPDDRERAGRTWSDSVVTGRLYEAEFRLKRRDGRYRWWLVRAVPVRKDGLTVDRWIGSGTDIDEIVEARDVLARSREQLEKLVIERTADRDRIWQLSPDVMLIASLDAKIVAINPAWKTLFDWDESDLIGRSFMDFVHQSDVEATFAEVDKLNDGMTIFKFENRYRAKDGSYRTLNWMAVPTSELIHAIGRDVTVEREAEANLARTEDALRQAQKMEAVGQLTGGIAHDFNNMLAVVIGSLDLLGRRLGSEDARSRRYVASAADAAKRAATLTQRLLAFSRQQPLQPEPIQINKLVSGMSDLLRHSLGASVHLETVLAGGLWQTHADPNQLENLILNLALNGRDAILDGGRLTIETQNAHLDPRYAAGHPGIQAGQYVMLAVTDNGSGMPPEVVAKAFDPFFTTKGIGKGTGLGLSQAYGFVRQSGGHIKIYSELGEGTTVKVYLPRFVGSQIDAREQQATADLQLGERQELVLVVEDEAAVREFSVDALVELGYRVIAAEDATTALTLLEAHPEVVLMFTDVVMPETNGAQLAEEARRRKPGLKILFTTGYTRNAVVHNGALDPGVEMVGKPFTIEELAAKVRGVLDGP